mmetsp:Transcript_8508/g.53159  ORF Transcript_8508/g.53159 Transcript_8508/m.53159 type:complete len:447 (+) Transcript_8508:2533-3873(+)
MGLVPDPFRFHVLFGSPYPFLLFFFALLFQGSSSFFLLLLGQGLMGNHPWISSLDEGHQALHVVQILSFGPFPFFTILLFHQPSHFSAVGGCKAVLVGPVEVPARRKSFPSRVELRHDVPFVVWSAEWRHGNPFPQLLGFGCCVFHRFHFVEGTSVGREEPSSVASKPAEAPFVHVARQIDRTLVCEGVVVASITAMPDHVATSVVPGTLGRVAQHLVRLPGFAKALLRFFQALRILVWMPFQRTCTIRTSDGVGVGVGRHAEDDVQTRGVRRGSTHAAAAILSIRRRATCFAQPRAKPPPAEQERCACIHHPTDVHTSAPQVPPPSHNHTTLVERGWCKSARMDARAPVVRPHVHTWVCLTSYLAHGSIANANVARHQRSELVPRANARRGDRACACRWQHRTFHRPSEHNHMHARIDGERYGKKHVYMKPWNETETKDAAKCTK